MRELQAISDEVAKSGATPLAVARDGRLLGIIFRIFGLTKLELTIVPLQVFLFYPLLILAVVMLAVYTSCGQIRHVQIWNMNKE